jgi:carbon storage regulator CsrA
MLVLSRRPNEKILIGPDIVLTVSQIQGNKVRIGIEAPASTRVLRAELAQKSEDNALSAAPLPAAGAGASHRILIVDDCSEDRSTFRRYLEAGDRPQSYSFAEASSGQEGLDLCGTRRPDCVLLDYRLPDLDGLEFLAEMKKETSGHAIPVIMLTGQGAEEIAVQAMKWGAVDYLVKQHITRESLRRSLFHALSSRSGLN